MQPNALQYIMILHRAAKTLVTTASMKGNLKQLIDAVHFYSSGSPVFQFSSKQQHYQFFSMAAKIPVNNIFEAVEDNKNITEILGQSKFASSLEETATAASCRI